MNEETLFHLTQQKPPGERAAYLDKVCPDAALRRRVESLLEAHDNPPSFMDRPAFDPSTMAAALTLDGQSHSSGSSQSTEAAGSCIGYYRLVEEIGQGGMGTVFMAEQTHPVRRQVALKIIKKGMDSREIIARFEAERQALALMDHPNIAKVLDAGTTDSGRPFFVMELVKGIPITRHCDERRLSPIERLTLFVAVCHAVHHAHQKGIIHRDIKPSNVLVAEFDGKPVPKVIDFGVAKAAGPRLTANTVFTELGSIVGTVEYMSPEQAGLDEFDVDTRSDIYSLGVLLYELLTGTTPLEPKRVKTAALLEVLRLVREEEAPRPSTRLGTTDGLPSIAACRGLEPRKLSGLVRGELDWIVMRALDKDRTRRYESANGLANDIRRYLDDEPVLACPPSAPYRMRKFVQRHKGAVLAASLVVLMLIGGIAGTASQAMRANAQASRANEEARRASAEAGRANEQAVRATAEAARANKERELAIAAGNAKESALAKQYAFRRQAMETLKFVVDDLLDRQLNRQASMSEADRGFCRNLIRRFREFAIVKGDTPASRNIRALGHFYMGRLRLETGDIDQAQFSFERALPLFEALVAEFPADLGYREMLGACHMNMGYVLLSEGKNSEGEAECVQAISDFNRVIAVAPVSPPCRQQLRQCYHRLGMLMTEQDRFDEAEKNYGIAIAVGEKLAADFPTAPINSIQLGGSYCNLGVILRYRGKSTGAMDRFDRAIHLLAPVYRNDPGLFKVGQFLTNSYRGRAVTLEQLGRLPEAIQDWDRVLALETGPSRMEFQLRRAKELARVDPAKAVAAAHELIQADPDNLENSMQHAEILLLAGAVDEYKNLCARQLEHSQSLKCQSLPGRRDYLLARLCLLAPDAITDSAAQLRRAQQAVLALPACETYLATLSLAHYRAGEYDQAITQIEQAMRESPNWAGQPLNWLILALANHRLGRTNDARHWIDQATRAMDNDPNGVPEALTAMGMFTQDWATCALLRNEAKTLAVDRRPSTSPTTRPGIGPAENPKNNCVNKNFPGFDGARTIYFPLVPIAATSQAGQ